jgi:hypothetical protein
MRFMRYSEIRGERRTGDDDERCTGDAWKIERNMRDNEIHKIF